METMANFFPRIDDLIENDLKHRSIRELRLLLRFGKSQFSRSAKKLGNVPRNRIGECEATCNVERQAPQEAGLNGLEVFPKRPWVGVGFCCFGTD